jgi:hypothetical protein
MEVDFELPPLSPPPSSLGGFGLKRKLQAIFLGSPSMGAHPRVQVKQIPSCCCDDQAGTLSDLGLERNPDILESFPFSSYLFTSFLLKGPR